MDMFTSSEQTVQQNISPAPTFRLYRLFMKGKTFHGQLPKLQTLMILSRMVIITKTKQTPDHICDL